MLFGVILDIDWYYPRDFGRERALTSIFSRGNKARSSLIRTEGICAAEDYGKGWRHVRYVGLLNMEQFKALCDELYLYPECDTMGSLGGPTPDAPAGTIFHVPAYCFASHDNDENVTCYVTPYALVWRKGGGVKPADRVKWKEDKKGRWERVIEALKRQFSRYRP